MKLLTKILTFIVILILLVSTWKISNTNEEYLTKEFLANYKDKLTHESDKITKIFDSIYTNMRAMAFTDEIKSFNTKGITEEQKRQLQNFFEAIEDKISLSEIYIVPKETSLLDNSSPHDLPSNILALVPSFKDEQEEDEKGVETYELEQISKQIEYFKKIAPDLSHIEGVNIPATSGQEVIICDNREKSSDHNTGFVYSIPYYDQQGVFAGVLAAVIKSDVLTRVFDDPYYQLKREVSAVNQVIHKNNGFNLKTKLSIIDNHPWLLEIEIPESVYNNSSTVKNIKQQKMALQIFGISTVILVIFLVFLSSNNILVKKLNQNLRQEIKMRKNSEERLSQFTSDAGHELRSPLAIMKGEVEVALLKERDTLEYKEVLQHVYQSINRLQQLVIDLLYINKMENGLDKIQLEPANLFLMLTDEFKFARERFPNKKNILIENQVSQSLNINVDEAKMRIVFSNLFSNAFKYSPDSTSIQVQCLSDNNEHTIIIKDQGTGVPEAELNKIFDRFYRTEKARTIGNGGLGLGLSIAQKIVELHKGTIRAYNSPNRGLTIEIKLPN